jgi:hypothetical protein
MSFYVSLTDTNSTFNTNLNTNIYLNQKYEVSLVDISIDSNVKVNFGYIKLQCRYNTGGLKTDIFLENNITVENFITYLNRHLTIERLYYLYKNDASRRYGGIIALSKEAFIKSQNDFIYLAIYEFFKIEYNKIYYQNMGFRLLEIGGLMNKFFKSNNFEELHYFKTDYITDTLPKRLNVLENIFLYTNIIEPQYFNNVKSQILRVVQCKYKHGHLDLKLNSDHYVDVKDTILNTINIELCDVNRNNIYLTNIFAQIVLKLHFRPKK